MHADIAATVSPPELTAPALTLLGKLQASLDPAEIVSGFANAMLALVPWQGFSWLPPVGAAVEPLFLGRERACQCRYTLSAAGQPLGELEISRTSVFDAPTVTRIEELLCALVFPLRNALLYQSARRSAATDPLTGLANRGALEHHLDRELARARRLKLPLSVLLVDVDRFKGLNDRYGHALGDRVLITVARALRHGLRGADLACRYGGDEFVVLLPDTSALRAAEVANRIRTLAADELRQAFGRRRVSLSMGLAQAQDTDTPADLLARADVALYAAKQGGRDQLVSAAG